MSVCASVAPPSVLQVYAATVAQLEQLDIWEKQRVFSAQRASRIAKDKAKQSSLDNIGVPGVITIFEDVQLSSMGVLDGQHRIGVREGCMQM